MGPHEAVAVAVREAGGSPAALAGAIGRDVKRQNVEYWLKRGVVPTEYCADVERVAQLKARRWHFRPDDWHLIWPELIGTDGAPPLPEPEVRNAA